MDIISIIMDNLLERLEKNPRRYRIFRSLLKLSMLNKSLFTLISNMCFGNYKINAIDYKVYRSKTDKIFENVSYVRRAVEIYGAENVRTQISKSHKYGRDKGLITNEEILELVAEHGLMKMHWGDLCQLKGFMPVSDAFIKYVKSLECKYTPYAFWLFVYTLSPILKEMLECKLPEDFSEAYPQFIMGNERYKNFEKVYSMPIFQKFENDHLLEVFKKVLRYDNQSEYGQNVIRKAMKLGNTEVLRIVFKRCKTGLLAHFPKEMILEEFKKYIVDAENCNASIVRHIFEILKL